MKVPPLVLIPAYKERQDIIDAVVIDWLAAGASVCVIDDGTIPPVQSSIKELVIIYHEYNQGQGAAIRTGLEYGLTTAADYFLTVDADGQHPAHNLSNLLQPLEENLSDIVFGSRFLRADYSASLPPFRKLVLKLAVYYNNYITGLRMTDAHNGLRAMNRRAAGQIRIEESRMAHASEIPIRVRQEELRWQEVAVDIKYTAYANGKGQSLWQVFPLSWQLLRLKWRNR